MQLKKWDSAQFLKNKEEMVEYLNACLDEGGDDPAFILHALGVVARAGNQRQLECDVGISQPGLHKVFSGVGKPDFATVYRIARALGVNIRFSA